MGYIQTYGCRHNHQNACERCIRSTQEMMRARLEECERLARTHVSEGGYIVHSLAEAAEKLPMVYFDKYVNNAIDESLTVDDYGRVLIVIRHVPYEYHGENYTTATTSYKLVEIVS